MNLKENNNLMKKRKKNGLKEKNHILILVSMNRKVSNLDTLSFKSNKNTL